MYGCSNKLAGAVFFGVYREPAARLPAAASDPQLDKKLSLHVYVAKLRDMLFVVHVKMLCTRITINILLFSIILFVVVAWRFHNRF